MIQVNIPGEMTNAAVQQVLFSIARAVTLNDKPAEITYVEEPGGGIRLTASFDTYSGERYGIYLVLNPE